MAEFNSAPYFPIDLKGLTALFALAPDADIRARAGRAIARLAEIVANSAHHGMLTAAQGRSYEHSLRAGWSSELSAVARLLWGRGGFGARFHCLPLARARAARPRPGDPPGPGPPRPLARPRRPGMVLPPGRGRLRGALSLQDPRLRARLGRALPLVRVGLPGDPGPRPDRHRAAGADLDQPPRRADAGRARPAVVLGRQRLDPAGPAVPRPRRRRLRRHGAAARLHPRLVPARRLRRKRASTAPPPSPARATGSRPSSPTARSRRSRPARAPAASSAAPAAAAAGCCASATPAISTPSAAASPASRSRTRPTAA